MKLDRITDIHEHVDLLRAALDQFRQESANQIMVIGDVFATGDQIHPTCELLAKAQLIGVWGNLDLGLCFDPPVASRQKFGDLVVDFMSSLQPRLEVEGCPFQHVEPWLNPNEITDLWYFEGVPDTPRECRTHLGGDAPSARLRRPLPRYELVPKKAGVSRARWKPTPTHAPRVLPSATRRLRLEDGRLSPTRNLCRMSK